MGYSHSHRHSHHYHTTSTITMTPHSLSTAPAATFRPPPIAAGAVSDITSSRTPIRLAFPLVATWRPPPRPAEKRSETWCHGRCSHNGWETCCCAPPSREPTPTISSRHLLPRAAAISSLGIGTHDGEQGQWFMPSWSPTGSPCVSILPSPPMDARRGATQETNKSAFLFRFVFANQNTLRRQFSLGFSQSSALVERLLNVSCTSETVLN
ncbi:hypothetical protein B0T18DRAFT_94634 [Schizothecium vesticola]|uniref:Uncharacterized protein n=1 Tax=Schizothecium vesticola TaxID=314040 RepID=A0AA40F7T5_9PEZI|nr:hypothetical protein B0T18DRAFT_94634 [Schizothecium vesticola]